jgi:hypothetical protein
MTGWDGTDTGGGSMTTGEVRTAGSSSVGVRGKPGERKLAAAAAAPER